MWRTLPEPSSELTPFKRGVVIGYAGAGVRASQIAIALNLPKSTVRDTLRNAPQRPQGFSIARIGRPLEHLERDERTLLRIVYINPRITYNKLAFKAGLPISQSMLH